MTTQNLVHGGDADSWAQAIYPFLAEKERRSGSMRTVAAYSGMLFHIFGRLGKPPNEVTAIEAFGYAHAIGLSGKKPSSITIKARIQRPHRLPQFLLPLPHPNEHGERQPLRPTGAPQKQHQYPLQD